ncbi:PAN domain-containing protein [Roseitalea porphyridii]|uniref:VWA domain-containing protein n=1 Tax=Roseitalea porphyridii TaxID=1852022 RepID=A0A4P6V1A3_9HYPH|nr:PAN domain-containing protein [Roseitalea porphyridii]QBK30454.1 VWA domain-containing protein [Roseitalea porphyridii]
MRKLTAIAAALMAGLVIMGGPAAAAERAIIVMDGSGSMWGQIDGRTKIEIARETLGGVLTAIPDDLELGLIAYGHRERGACSDIEEIVAPGTGNRDAIAEAVGALNPKGKTPISDAVRIAAESLRYTEDKATVILVTDGIETCEADPCAAATALDQQGIDFTAHVIGFGLSDEEGAQVSCLAENTGGKFIMAGNADELGDALTETVTAEPEPEPQFAIGPGMEDGVDRPGSDFERIVLTDADPAICQSACEDNAACLAWTFVKPGVQRDDAVCYLKEPAPAARENDCCISGLSDKPVPVDRNLTAMAMLAEDVPLDTIDTFWEVFPIGEAGQPGDRVDYRYERAGYDRFVEPGRYLLRGSAGMVSAETTVDLSATETTDTRLVYEAGIVDLTVAPAEGLEPDGNAYINIAAGDETETAYGRLVHVVPAGAVDLTVRIGEAELTETLDIAAGQTLERTVIVPAGRLTTGALYAEGGPVVESGNIRYDVFSAKKKLDGSRTGWTGSYGAGDYMLPPGDYVVEARLGIATAEAPVSIGAGELSEVELVMDAGVLAIEAPGARRIDVLAGKADIEGDRARLEGAYGEALQVTAPGGDYLVRVEYQGDRAPVEQAVSVTAGERTETTIE